MAIVLDLGEVKSGELAVIVGADATPAQVNAMPAADACEPLMKRLDSKRLL